MSEVPLYTCWFYGWQFSMSEVTLKTWCVQGYLAHKNPPLLGPYSRTIPGDLWRS